MSRGKKPAAQNPQQPQKTATKLQRIAEPLASAAMCIIAAGLIIPLFNLFDTDLVATCKWVFTTGAFLFVIARAATASRTDGSVKVRRLRRLEFWGATCFAVAAFFWFYNSAKLAGLPFGTGTLALLRDTILFSLAGAMIQVVASWLIYFREKKEREQIAGG